MFVPENCARPSPRPAPHHPHHDCNARPAKRRQPLLVLCAALIAAPLLFLPVGAAQQTPAAADTVTVDTGATARVFSAKELDRQFGEIEKGPITGGGGGAKLGDYGNHTIGLSLRTASGGAEIHEHFNDILFVRRGKATLCTGGTVVDGKTISEGEIKGTGIQGGTKQTIAAGDVIHIPAGTPHQILLEPGATVRILVVKVKQ